MQCPNCGQDMKLIPAGTSKKSGKSYNAFYSCPECKETMNPNTDSQIQEKHYAKAPVPPATVKTNGIDNDFGYKCNAMNNACNLMAEMIKAGATFQKSDLEVIYNEILGILKG